MLARVAEAVAEGVELLDVAKLEAGLLLHPAAEPQFQRAVALGIERPERQGTLHARPAAAARVDQRVHRAANREHARSLAGDRDDHGVESDGDWAAGGHDGGLQPTAFGLRLRVGTGLTP